MEADETKYFTPTEALEKAHAAGIDITYATLLTWVEKHKVGFQPGGAGSKWYIDREKFDSLINGKTTRGGVNGATK